MTLGNAPPPQGISVSAAHAPDARRLHDALVKAAAAGGGPFDGAQYAAWAAAACATSHPGSHLLVAPFTAGGADCVGFALVVHPPGLPVAHDEAAELLDDLGSIVGAAIFSRRLFRSAGSASPPTAGGGGGGGGGSVGDGGGSGSSFGGGSSGGSFRVPLSRDSLDGCGPPSVSALLSASSSSSSAPSPGAFQLPADVAALSDWGLDAAGASSGELHRLLVAAAADLGLLQPRFGLTPGQLTKFFASVESLYSHAPPYHNFAQCVSLWLCLVFSTSAD